MAKVILVMWMSVDGFIAGPDDVKGQELGAGGDVLHSELNDANPTSGRPENEGAAKVFDELMATGAVITGRRTFDLAGRWRGGDHHDGVPIFVLSRTPHEPYGHARYFSDLKEAVAQAKAAAGDRDIMAHGGSAAQALLRAGLVEELELGIAPVLLGGGRRLFEDLEASGLEKVRTIDGGNGTVHIRYRVGSPS